MVGASEGWTFGTNRAAEGRDVDDGPAAEGMRAGAVDHLTQALYVKALVEGEGLGLGQAIRRAAKRYGVSEATAQRCYEDHGHAVGDPSGASDVSAGRPQMSLAGAPGRRAIWVREAAGTRPT